MENTIHAGTTWALKVLLNLLVALSATLVLGVLLGLLLNGFLIYLLPPVMIVFAYCAGLRVALHLIVSKPHLGWLTWPLVVLTAVPLAVLLADPEGVINALPTFRADFK